MWWDSVGERRRDFRVGYAVLPGSPPNAQSALEVVAQSERHTGISITATIDDAAYGDGHAHQRFAGAGCPLITKEPKGPARAQYPKVDFQIDLPARPCTCPAC